MTSKIIIAILVVSLIFNLALVIILIPFKTQQTITPLKTCVSNVDCGSGFECKYGVLCDKDSDNCVTTNYCQLKTISEPTNNKSKMTKEECTSSKDCSICGNNCYTLSATMVMDCPSTTEDFDCVCENNRCVKHLDSGDTEGCTKEGEDFVERDGECCSGLKAITGNYRESLDGECMALDMMQTSICAKCGNNICGPGEDKCNCPEDCE